MRPKNCCSLSLLVASLASPAAAHDTWLLPTRFELPARTRVEADLTSGMGFPALESPVRASRLAVTGLRVGGRSVPLEAGTPGKTSLRLSAAADGPGVAVLWVRTRPRTLSLTPAQVQEYLPEIGASPEVEARWRRQQRWRETYSKLAKSVVRLGQPEGDRSWQDPVGLELEVVPLDDPTTLRAGSQIHVRVLRSGRPLAAFPLSAVAAGSHEAAMQKTAADGTATFAVDRPGAWMIRGTLIEESSAPDADWKSLFTTLTFSAGPRP